MSTNRFKLGFRRGLKLPFLLILLAIIAVAIILLIWPARSALIWPARSAPIWPARPAPIWPARLAGMTKASLGQCLQEKGVTMYGVDTCVNCQEQKKLFGADFGNVNYVNCDFQKELCEKKGIRYYPLWNKGNEVLIGLQSLQALADFGECGVAISN